MSKLTAISDELHGILKANEEGLKADFLTLRLFVDSAIKTALRKRGIQPGPDDIIAHLDKLRESKARHINQQALIHKRNNHKRRVQRQQEALDQMTEE